MMDIFTSFANDYAFGTGTPPTERMLVDTKNWLMSRWWSRK
jgi:hypothetical protein